MMTILSVSDITALIREKLEQELPPQYIEGEISDCRFHGSGHVYLTLKDQGAVIPAVIWKSSVPRLKDRPRAGMHALVYGRLSVYPPHGKYQLIISALQEAGEGVLHARFEAMKSALKNEGLFDAERKVPVPEFPQTVGLVTSETGAALQDMLRVFRQSAPHVKLILSPARVQGKGAELTVIGAMEALIAHKPDCVIVARGGGSLEDLWAFNEEVLARYTAAYPIPVVSGVGHETDTSILDYVADQRCSTPTNAAEYVCASWRDMSWDLNRLDERLDTALRHRLELYRSVCDRFHTIVGPENMARVCAGWRERLDMMKYRMAASSRIPEGRGRELSYLSAQLNLSCDRVLREKHRAMLALDRQLQAYDPAHVLRKGYSMVRSGNQILRSGLEVKPQDRIEVDMADAILVSKVEKICKKDRS